MRITRQQLRRVIKEVIEGPDGVWYDDYGNRLQPDESAPWGTHAEQGDGTEYDEGHQDGLEDLPPAKNAGPDYNAGYDAGRLDADLPETDWRASRSEDW